MAMRFYLIPREEGTIAKKFGPKYFTWRFDPDPPGIASEWSSMPYGFVPSWLVLAHDISDADHAALVAHADVFGFPVDLSGPVDQNIQPFFEGINIPTDWLTPSTTWLELLRQLAGMFQFAQRYNGVSGGGHNLFSTATLDTRLRDMTAQEQTWFLATVESFGVNPALVNMNSRLRQLVKTAGNYWASLPFYMGGIEF